MATSKTPNKKEFQELNKLAKRAKKSSQDIKNLETLEQKVRKTSPAQFKQKNKETLKWFIDRVGKNDFNDDAFKQMKSPEDTFIGGMFHYVYDPKWKDTLPYYDVFPLIIMINVYDDGFLGMNLHYLPPILRAKLLDELMKYKKTKSNRDYMNLSYKLLKGLSNSKLMEPTIKRYLYSHIKSKVVRVNSEYWEEVAFLPSYDFRKASASKVWSDSRKSYEK